MELNWLYTSLIFSTLIIAMVVSKLLFPTRGRSPKLPPSPPGARPIFGHLHLLENPLHRTLHKLSLKHGPIFSLRLGSRLAVVASSPTAVEECFTRNDAVFANRPHSTLHRHLGYNYTALVSADYGDHWRNLRRLCSAEIFSPGRLNMFLSIREDEIKHLLSGLYYMSTSGGGGFTRVELRWKLCELTFNNITRMVAGKRYYGDVGIENKEEAKRFQELISAAFKLSGASNAGDYLPILRWIDYAGIEKKMSIISKKMDKFLQGLIDGRRQFSPNSNDTMIDHLLSFQQSQPDYYTDEIIKGLVLVTLIGGTNTSETTIEWAMSLLVNHPQVLKKARDEIDTHVGIGERLVKEEDLSKLPYLNSIVSETFRLFPPLPLVLPHESSQDCKLGGYDVPRGTIILANAWAVHRDPELWDEPNCFRPERFEKAGGENKLLQFGMGRRVCPGAGLGQRVVGSALASLIQSFEWDRVSAEKVDLDEGTGLAMPRANPLVVMFKPRQVMAEVFNNLTL